MSAVEYPSTLTLKFVDKELDFLAAEEARLACVDKPSITVEINKRKAAKLWFADVKDPISSCRSDRTEPAEFAQNGETSSLARFHWTTSENLDPRTASLMLSGPVYKSKQPCFWAVSGKVLELLMLERMGPQTAVYYQLVRTRSGELLDACFVSHWKQQYEDEFVVGEWTVTHPKCPTPREEIRRCHGMAAFFMRAKGGGVAEIAGISQMARDRQALSVRGFLAGLSDFQRSRLGLDCARYIGAGAICKPVIGELVQVMWRWVTDVGLWSKGRSQRTKVWRSGRGGTTSRALRFQGALPNVHAGTLAQAMFLPEFRFSMTTRPEHSVNNVKVLETLGDFAMVLHVEETFEGRRRDCCIMTCIASLGPDAWIIADWSVEHPKAPRTKGTRRLATSSASMICTKDGDNTALVVAREIVADEGSVAEAEQELEDLPFGFAESMTRFLQSAKGRELLRSSGQGLRGRAMHGGAAWLPPVVRYVPCFVDCLDGLLEGITCRLCCRRERLRIDTGPIFV